LGPLSGIWDGRYEYSPDAGMTPVTFILILIQEGDKVMGMMREPNTMSDRPEQWLYATVDGRFLDQGRELIVTKTSEDAEGMSHSVQYKGQVSADSSTLEKGRWTIPGFMNGTFTMKRRTGVAR
jgi:hypothetical protein